MKAFIRKYRSEIVMVLATLLMVAMGWLFGEFITLLPEWFAIIAFVSPVVFSHYQWIKNPLMGLNKEELLRRYTTKSRLFYLQNVCAVTYLVVLISNGFSVMWVGLVTAAILYSTWQLNAVFEISGITDLKEA